MNWMWIGGGILLFCVIYALYEFVTDPSHINEEEAEDIKHESPNDRERALFDHKKEVADATKQDIEDGYSQQ